MSALVKIGIEWRYYKASQRGFWRVKDESRQLLNTTHKAIRPKIYMMVEQMNAAVPIKRPVRHD